MTSAEQNTAATSPAVGAVRPDPSDDEAAAIVAAVETLWATMRTTSEEPETPSPTRWRFSGRWWAKPVPLRRYL